MAQVRRINEQLKLNGAYDLKSPLSTPHSPSPLPSFHHKLHPNAIEQEPTITSVPKAISQASPDRLPKDAVSAIKSEPIEHTLALDDHASQTKEAPEQSSRRVTFASPNRSEIDQTSDTPSSQLHLYNLQLERERVERLEKELASVKAKVIQLIYMFLLGTLETIHLPCIYMVHNILGQRWNNLNSTFHLHYFSHLLG
jgi:hypothetical protein